MWALSQISISKDSLSNAVCYSNSIYIHIYVIFVSKNKVCQEKKITFKVFIASWEFIPGAENNPSSTVLPVQRVLTLRLTTSLWKICLVFVQILALLTWTRSTHKSQLTEFAFAVNCVRIEEFTLVATFKKSVFFTVPLETGFFHAQLYNWIFRSAVWAGTGQFGVRFKRKINKYHFCTSNILLFHLQNSFLV